MKTNPMTDRHAHRAPALVAALAMAMGGCVGTKQVNYAGTEASAGAAPANPEAAIKVYLRRALKDPDSLKDFAILSKDIRMCNLPDGRMTYAWMVNTEYNAKNSYGGYVGLAEHAFWFRGEQFLGAVASDWSCPPRIDL